MLKYRKAFFNPTPRAGFARVTSATGQREDWAYRPRPEGEVFVFMQEAVLALNVALATRRPLLISGEPGGGKTSLALCAARAMNRRFYRQTITSRTQVTDLLSGFDAVRRLGDAQHRQDKERLKDMQSYVIPGELWWALDPLTAATRGAVLAPGDQPLADPGRGGSASKAVILLDEIDKADPDVPNDLLEVLDEGRFTVPETREIIRKTRDDLLIVLTTNDERELPPAFMRRCVTLQLPGPPDAAWLLDVALGRYPVDDGDGWADLYRSVAAAVIERRDEARRQGRRMPSTSEFLDAIAACRELAHAASKTGPADVKALVDQVLDKDRTVRPPN